MGKRIVTSSEYEDIYTNRKRLDLMKSNRWFLHLACVIPSNETLSSRPKKLLFFMCHTLIHLLYLTSTTAQIYGTYQLLGDSVMFLESMVFAVGLHGTYIPLLHIITNWRHFEKIVTSLETNSVFTKKIILSNPKFVNIIRDTKKQVSVLTIILASTYAGIIISWAPAPMILHLTDKFLKNNTGLESNISEVNWNHFLYIMWVPNSATSFPMYEIIYIFQVALFSHMLVCSFAFTNFYFPLMIYTTTQFKIVSAVISELDTKIESSGDHSSKTTLHNANILENRNQNKHSTHHKGHNSELVSELNTIKENENNSIRGETLGLEECIKLHQAAMRWTKELDNVLKALFFFWSLLLIVVLVGETFQLSLDVDLKKKSQYGSALFVSLTQPFMMHWFGESLILQSQAVGDAAYEILWYQRSIPFQKQVLMIQKRSQIPLRFSIGPISEMRMKTFASILQVSYRCFTFLLQMHKN